MNKWVLLTVVIILSFAVGYFISGWYSSSTNSELESQIEKLKTDKAEIDKEKEALKQQIELKQSDVSNKENEISDLQNRVSASQKKIAIERDKVQKAIENYENEIKVISVPTDNYTRCIRLCTSRAELGYSCTPDFCNQYK